MVSQKYEATVTPLILWLDTDLLEKSSSWNDSRELATK